MILVYSLFKHDLIMLCICPFFEQVAAHIVYSLQVLWRQIDFSPKICSNLNMQDERTEMSERATSWPDTDREIKDCELRCGEIGQSISRFRTC